MAGYRVPFSNVSIRNNQAHKEEWVRSLTSVLENGTPVLGNEVRKFESGLSQFVGVSNAIGVANGTDALTIGLLSLGVIGGEGVAVVANAGGYSSIACNQIGAEIVYVDVDENGQMSPESLDEVLQDNPKLRAVIVTHLYGLIGEIEAIKSLCQKNDLLLIEDCAQAIGSKRPSGLKAGSFGDLSTFSFYPTKNLGALGDGGAILTNNHLIAKKARSLREYGWNEKFLSLDPAGRNSRLDEFQAAGLNFKLPKLENENASRLATWTKYRDVVDQKESLKLIGSDDGSYNGHLCVIYSTELSRDELVHHFDSCGIQTLIHYPYPDYTQPGIKSKNHRQVATPMTDQMCERVFSIPLHAFMERASVELVLDAIASSPEVQS